MSRRANAAQEDDRARERYHTEGLTAALRCHSRKVRNEPGRVVRDPVVGLADGGDGLRAPAGPALRLTYARPVGQTEGACGDGDGRPRSGLRTDWELPRAPPCTWP